MSNFKAYGVRLLAGIVVGLGSCSTSPQAEVPSASPTPTVTQPSPPTNSPSADRLTVKSSTSSAAPTRTIPVTIYKADSQCLNLVPEQVAVAADRPLESAVGKVLEQQDNDDFSLSGYRVSVDPNGGSATIDLRMAPKSKRGITSLSSCEQLALFGSLRKTLTSNAQWKINSVLFTERGKEIVL